MSNNKLYVVIEDKKGFRNIIQKKDRNKMKMLPSNDFHFQYVLIPDMSYTPKTDQDPERRAIPSFMLTFYSKVKRTFICYYLSYPVQHQYILPKLIDDFLACRKEHGGPEWDNKEALLKTLMDGLHQFKKEMDHLILSGIAKQE